MYFFLFLTFLFISFTSCFASSYQYLNYFLSLIYIDFYLPLSTFVVPIVFFFAYVTAISFPPPVFRKISFSLNIPSTTVPLTLCLSLSLFLFLSIPPPILPLCPRSTVSLSLFLFLPVSNLIGFQILDFS